MTKMKRTLFVLVMICTMIFGTGYVSRAVEGENLLANGGFEDRIADPWSAYGSVSINVVQELRRAAVDEDVIEGESCLYIEVLAKGATFWDSGLQHSGHIFEAGKVYTLSAYLKSADGPMQINFKPELSADPWTGYGAKAFTMTEEWRLYSTTTPPMPSDVNPAAITFHIAYDVGEFWVDDVRFYEGTPDVEPVEPDEPPVVGKPKELENGGFETGSVDPWSLYGDGSIEVVRQLEDAAVPEDPVEGKYALHITVNSAGANFWDIGLQQGDHVFERGEIYTLAAFLKSKEGSAQINFKPELSQDPWTGFGAQEFTMTEEWEEYYITTPMMPDDIDPASLTFHIGYAPVEFWMDGVRFYEGEYEEPEFTPVRAVKPHDKLSSTWGSIKSD